MCECHCEVIIKSGYMDPNLCFDKTFLGSELHVNNSENWLG